MLGYIMAYKPEMRIKEFEMYKAVYCTLCKQLGRDYGIFARFTLSYDFTFLALLKMSLTDGDTECERKRCAFNPLKKCNYCKTNTDDFDFSAAVAMIMMYYKLLDNISDEKGIKRLGFMALKPLFALAYKKAAKKQPEADRIVADYITAQNILEKQNCDNLDAAANPTAECLSKLFMLCAENDFNKRALSRLGYCMGRYIYILDAAADLEKDIRKNRYNVLKNYGDACVRTEIQLTACINEAVKAFELLNIYRYKNILGNIIYLGLDETFKKETAK